MSNATHHSRQSGDHKRRRSRGGKNRAPQHRDSRQSDRAEEFRPQSPRPPRHYTPVKLTWWQKLLKAIGLYKAPAPPQRGGGQGGQSSEARAARPPKSNIRNARNSEGGETAPAKGARPERSNRGGDRSTVESPRVYVGNLSYDVSEQDLQELFKGIGGVRNVEIVYNRNTHRSKGYGFVEMLHTDEAMRAVEVLHDQPFMGRKLNVSGAKSKGQDEREDHEERNERPQAPVVLAPRPAAAAAAVTPSEEPTIPTIVESVTPAAVAPETPETPAAAAAAEAPKAEAPAHSENMDEKND